MSYASIAAHDAPSPSEQPHPDPALLSTKRSPSSNAINDTSKENVVSSELKDKFATYTSDTYDPENTEGDIIIPGKISGKDKERKRRLQEAQAEGTYLWEVTKRYLLRPGVAGGFIGLVNIAFLSSVGYVFYKKPDLRRNFTAIGSATAGAMLLIGTEGYAADKYRETPRGHQEERSARGEGTLLFKHFREQALPLSAFGLVNTAILGAVGYYSYANWNKPKWNRDVVTAVSLGLLTLWGGEGYRRYRADRRRQ